jgi:hypothetical protein
MIHVAEAGEARGRVVVHLSSTTASTIAIDAAVWLARAFQSEIEGVYVENLQLLEMASFPFAREVSLTGRASRALSCADLEREFRHASSAFHAEIAARARAAEIRVHARVVRDEPVSALSRVCADCGPWNAVALAEPFTSPGCPPLKDLLETVRDATGLLVVGPRAERTSGPIVVALEQAEALPALLSAAQRLSVVGEQQVLICLVAGEETGLMELDIASRLVLGEQPDIQIAAQIATRGSEATAAEALRRLRPGLIVARFGGQLVPESGDLRPLAASLECPLLLLR